MPTTPQLDLDAQYRVLRESAGVVVRGDRAVIEVAGSEAGEYLQGQLTNDVERLQPGEGCYSALLDRKGHMQGDMRVLRLDDAFGIGTEAVAAPAVLRHLTMYKIGREVEVIDRSDELTVVSVIGPAAAHLALGGPLAPEHAHREQAVGEISARAIATDLGIDFTVGRDEAQTLVTALVAQGVEPVDELAAEIVRVESGRPRFGREMTTATIPQEAGINERAVSFEQGLLHRPGDGRAAALQGQAEPPPARAAALRPGDPRRRGPARRARARDDRHRGPLPRPRADRARDPAARGRARRQGRGRDRARGRGRRAALVRRSPEGEAEPRRR